MSGKTPLGAAFGRLRCLPNQVIATPSLAPTSDIHRTARRQASRASEITDLFGGRPARGLVDRLLRDLRWMSTLPAAIPWPLSRWLRRGPRPKPEASTIPARCGAGLRPTRFHTAWRCDCDPRARRDCLSCRCPLRVENGHQRDRAEYCYANHERCVGAHAPSWAVARHWSASRSSIGCHGPRRGRSDRHPRPGAFHPATDREVPDPAPRLACHGRSVAYAALLHRLKARLQLGKLSINHPMLKWAACEATSQKSLSQLALASNRPDSQPTPASFWSVLGDVTYGCKPVRADHARHEPTDAR